MGRNKSNFVDLCQGDFGRKTAYTGVAQITTENVIQVLSDTIGTHNRNRMMINYLYRYYISTHEFPMEVHPDHGKMSFSFRYNHPGVPALFQFLSHSILLLYHPHSPL